VARQHLSGLTSYIVVLDQGRIEIIAGGVADVKANSTWGLPTLSCPESSS
jgi:hypothetical protein